MIHTINEVFYCAIERNIDRALLTKRPSNAVPAKANPASAGNDAWTPISSRELYRNVVGVARELENWGIEPGDRVAILSENRAEWAVADFATLLLGAVTVPIYSTLTADQTLHLLRDSGARVVFVSSHEQLRKVMEVRERCFIEKIVLMDGPEAPGAIPMTPLMESGPASRDEAFDRRALAVGGDELATIIYTSGTTGVPKGVMLTQGNLATNLLHSLYLHELKVGQISISYLPLSHVLARHLDYVMFWHGVTIAYCPSPDELVPAVQELKPQVFVAVPRVYEKILNGIRSKSAKGVKRHIFEWALAVGQAHKDEVLSGREPATWKWRLADKLVFSKVRAALGGRVEFFVSGGAPLGLAVLDSFASIGIRVCEGYGLTETSPIVSVSNLKNFRCGSVGKVIRNVQVRIADDGEILVKGPSVFKGYWNLPADTESAFDGEWFRTGDIGQLDGDGFLYITDRKKDLIKTSGGKFIAPQLIEGKLKASQFIEEAVIVADGRNFVSVVIVPSFPALESWAELNHVPIGLRQELVERREVLALYEGIVAEVNKDLARFESIKRFIIVPDEFSIANGALTPTMKLKRRFIEQRYRKQLDELYSGETSKAVS